MFKVNFRTFGYCMTLYAAFASIALPARADVCKPWQTQMDTNCVDKPGLQTQSLGYEPGESETCWERSQVTCRCESWQSAGLDSCGSCEMTGESKLDIVCLPY